MSLDALKSGRVKLIPVDLVPSSSVPTIVVIMQFVHIAKLATKSVFNGCVCFLFHSKFEVLHVRAIFRA